MRRREAHKKSRATFIAAAVAAATGIDPASVLKGRGRSEAPTCILVDDGLTAEERRAAAEERRTAKVGASSVVTGDGDPVVPVLLFFAWCVCVCVCVSLCAHPSKIME